MRATSALQPFHLHPNPFQPPHLHSSTNLPQSSYYNSIINSNCISNPKSLFNFFNTMQIQYKLIKIQPINLQSNLGFKVAICRRWQQLDCQAGERQVLDGSLAACEATTHEDAVGRAMKRAASATMKSAARRTVAAATMTIVVWGNHNGSARRAMALVASGGQSKGGKRVGVLREFWEK